MKLFYFSLLVFCSGLTSAQVIPTASFVTSQSSVCPNVTIQVTDQSSGSATSWTYVVDGTTSLTVPNPVVSFSTDGWHYIEQYAQNIAGISAPYGQAVLVHPAPVVATGTAGTAKLYPPNGSTNGWLPLVFNFNDPLPAGAILSGITITFTGVDQGWGGTGDPAIFYLAGKQVGFGILQHSANNYTITKMAPFPNYVYGGSNNLEMYFTGYPGWQGFFSNGDVTLYYHTVVSPLTLCGGSTVTLNGIGANTYTWQPAAPNGVGFVPLSSNIYTVTGTSTLGCVGSMTQQVIISTPTIVAASGAICPGQNFVISPSGASTYSITGGSYTVSPATSASYSVTGTNTLGCVSLSPAVVQVTVVALPVLSINSGSVCVGSSFTLQPSGAATYTFQGGSPVLTVSASGNYSVTGANTLGCEALLPAIASITAVPVPTLSAQSKTICAGTTHSIQVSGASSYVFSGGGPLVSPLVTTSYSITGSTAGCSAQTLVTIAVDACASVLELATDDFMLFPQPADGVVSLRVTSGGSYILRDLAGRLLHTAVISAGATVIDCSHMAEGIYMLTVVAGEQSYHQRLVIRH